MCNNINVSHPLHIIIYMPPLNLNALKSQTILFNRFST